MIKNLAKETLARFVWGESPFSLESNSLDVI
jgi:hypothetical protein